MLPAILGLGGLTAKIIATAVIPRVVRAISSSFSTTRPLEPCPPSPVEGISSGPDPAPASVLSGVSGTPIRSRKWGYAGLWHHSPSGLDLATYRLYDAANKRWISRDPLGEAVDLNLYRYANNSPVNHQDRTGLDIRVTTRQDPNGPAYSDWFSTTSDLIDYLRHHRQRDIERIEFEGHASSCNQSCSQLQTGSPTGSIDTYQTKGKERSVKLTQPGGPSWDFVNLLRGKLLPNALIVLGGCSNADGPDNLAKILSSNLPDAFVLGNRSPRFHLLPTRGSSLDRGWGGDPILYQSGNPVLYPGES